MALVVLAAIGALFVTDPGGAIAESGFPEFQEMDWKQFAVWGFRTIGMVAAQLIIVVLWFWPKWRPPKASTWSSVNTLPGSMPAATVYSLQGHAVWSPTILASILEMCQRGTLRIEAVETRVGFLYRLSRQGATQYDWERTICDSLSARPTTIDALDETLKKRLDIIGDQIGDHLQRQGLFRDNPVRVRRENDDDSAGWGLLVGPLMGVGVGFWAALWLDWWWANALIGALIGLVYLGMVPTILTGMLKPTPSGTLEISQWLGWRDAMAESGSMGARDHSDPMLPYAVALDVARPWLDLATPAPRWFRFAGGSSLRGADLDAAYHAFLHAPEWWLRGRSNDAAKAAAQHGYEEELRLLGQLDRLELPDAEQPEHTARAEMAGEFEDMAREPEAQVSPPPVAARASSTAYQPQRVDGMVSEEKGGGCLRGCFTRVVSLAVIAVVILLVLFSLDVVSPREKPCPLNSPPIPTPAQIVVMGDLFRDQCVTVRGTVVAQDANELVMEIDRGEHVQQVTVRDPSQALESTSPDRLNALAGWLRIEEDGTYVVHFIPDRGSDRSLWRNLRENLAGLF